MNPAFLYLLKVNIAIALFLIVYQVFFINDTFWKIRRMYFLTSVFIAFIYPSISLQSWLNQSTSLREFSVDYLEISELVVTPASSVIFSWNELLAAVYVFVLAVLLVRLLFQFISVVKVHYSSKPSIIMGIGVRTLTGNFAPFSFFGTIYLNPSLHSGEELNQILTHELAHVRQWHSVDVMVSELLCALFWINPFVWLLRKAIRLNLEYLADDRVVASGVDSRRYQYHLLQLSCQLPGIELTNQFNISPLKKRIRMINQPRSSKSTVLKYLLIVPLSFTLIILSNASTPASSPGDLLPAARQELLTENVIVPSDTIKEDETIFVVVEDMPEFPGGTQAMMNYLAESIKYPVGAQVKGVQGRVICQFVIDRNGKVTNPVVIRGVSPELDEEALRVISIMPDWKPGTQRGKAVRVKYTLPINFRLNNKEDINASLNKPMIIVNDEIKAADFDMKQINPETIQEMIVLKADTEEESNELVKKYGQRAAGGVILLKVK